VCLDPRPQARRIWVFDRGVVSEANLTTLRQHGAHYVVGTPRSQLKQYEEQLLSQDWQQISPAVKVQLLPEGNETFVLARSEDRARKEEAMRWRQVRGLMRDLVCLRRAIRPGTLKDEAKILMRVGRLSERWPRGWAYVKVHWEHPRLSWQWDREAMRLASLRDGAYLLRTNLNEHDPQSLWRMYVQLTEVEAVFRAMKSELAIRLIWHWVTCKGKACPTAARGMPQRSKPPFPARGRADHDYSARGHYSASNGSLQARQAGLGNASLSAGTAPLNKHESPEIRAGTESQRQPTMVLAALVVVAPGCVRCADRRALARKARTGKLVTGRQHAR